MSGKFEKFAPHILGLTRILFGVMLASHGAQKVLGAFGGVPEGTPAAIVWVAGSIELLGGALIALGLFTRPAAFLNSGLLAVAYFMAHAPKGFWPIENGGELAIIYSWFSLYLVARGPGAFALERVLTARRELASRPAIA
ncbi:MAG: DoxX family protein [Vicinamibacteria bacterium]|nr:DoxX family protein [Vicinamibacteria bacterium]MBP9946421.1 DoxX family protein [Vicinamibacteria bacterium]